MNRDPVAIVGAGRVGLSLARALVRSGSEVLVLARTQRLLPDPLVAPVVHWAHALERCDLIMLAVPDDAIGDVAAALVGSGAIGPRHVILHTSGLHGRAALAALAATGAALGSWHPLQTFASVDGEPDAFVGAPAIVEGDARAIEAAEWLAHRLQLNPVVTLSADGKPAYHAAAVFASNYLVVLAELARRLGVTAGAGDSSAHLFVPLMRQTLNNYASLGAEALTGPIRRGDAGTVRQHLGVLQGAERTLYMALGLEALRLARASGLDAVAASELERLLTAG